MRHASTVGAAQHAIITSLLARLETMSAMTDKRNTDRAVETTVPESLVGSGGEFERSKGIHLLPEVNVPQDVLPPPAAVTVQPTAQGSSPAEPAPPSASDGSD
jgi:hypothetical protein